MTDSIFRPMNQSDVGSALAIIETHDEDDFECAQTTYRNSLAGQYVLEHNSQVIGVTGANQIEGTDRSYVVSWTYLQRNFIGRGQGRVMMENLIERITGEGARKLFVSTSDYVDPEIGDIYRDAREAYRAIGFTEELRHQDYYNHGETQLCYGLRIQHGFDAPPTERNQQRIRLTDVDEIDECDGAFWLAWELDDEGTDPRDFEMICNQVREWEGRVIFMAFPSDVALAAEFMTRCRFRPDGTLQDYYQDGIHEDHYRFNL